MAAANGSISANGQLNGHANKKILSRQPKKRSSGFISWTMNNIVRRVIWLAIFVIAFRCPNTIEECNETSPFICSRYFQARQLVVPHIEPFYDQYARPYVDIAKPYYNTVNERVLTPSRTYAVHYASPYVSKGRDYALTLWEEKAQPHLAELQAVAQANYESNVAPYLAKATDAASPYYSVARKNAQDVYEKYLLPGFEVAQPHVARGYAVAADVTTKQVLPTVYWAYERGSVFLDTVVWPQTRLLYVEHVEPQLVRIGERLGRYKTRLRDSKSRDKPVLSEASESAQSIIGGTQTSTGSVAPASSVSQSSSASSTAQQGEESALEYGDAVKAPSPDKNESEKRKTVREMVAEDLKLWQTKFATQAEEGASVMGERIEEIAQAMVSSSVNATGKQLATSLEQTISASMEGLKDEINRIVVDSDDKWQVAEEAVVQSIRGAGAQIREQAQGLRDWHAQFTEELHDKIIQAAEVHFLILDETRNLALQQIGQKWAWADGVTFKDWEKYHELKSTLTQWTEQLKDLITSHSALVAAEEAAAHVEDEGMGFASEAAHELAQLKEVAHYKIIAKDATDNFEIEALKIAAHLAQEAREAAKEAARKAKEAEEEAASLAADASETLTVSLANAFEEGQEYVSEAGSAISSSANEAASAASSVIESQSTAASQSASSLLSEGETLSAEASSSVSAAVSSGADKASSGAEHVASVASSLASEATEKIIGGHEEVDTSADDLDPVVDGESLTVEEDPMTEREETPPSDTPSVKPAFLGAAAQKVSDRQPILEDYVDTDFVASATDAAQSVYSTAVAKASEQYSSAVSVISAQIYGTPKPVHQQLFASVSSAYDAAVTAASQKLDFAAKAIPTPTQAAPTKVDWSKVESIAAQRLNEGRLWAEVQYQSALIALGLATATPTSGADKIYQQAKLNYYAGLGLAQERYASFMSAASSAFSSITATPTPTDFVGTASSIASVARESAGSFVNAAEEAAEAAYSAATGSIASIIDEVEGTVNSAIDGAADQVYIAGKSLAESWDTVVSELNARIYGETNPLIGWYDNIVPDASSLASSVADAITEKASAATKAAADTAATASSNAGQQYDAVSQLISELLVGKEPTFSESVVSRLGAAYSTASANVESFASGASSAAASVGERVVSAASEATEAVKETVQNVRDEL